MSEESLLVGVVVPMGMLVPMLVGMGVSMLVVVVVVMVVMLVTVSGLAHELLVFRLFLGSASATVAHGQTSVLFKCCIRTLNP